MRAAGRETDTRSVNPGNTLARAAGRVY